MPVGVVHVKVALAPQSVLRQRVRLADSRESTVDHCRSECCVDVIWVIDMNDHSAPKRDGLLMGEQVHKVCPELQRREGGVGTAKDHWQFQGIGVEVEGPSHF